MTFVSLSLLTVAEFSYLSQNMVLLDKRNPHSIQNTFGLSVHLQAKYEQKVIDSFSFCGLPINCRIKLNLNVYL